MCHNQVKYALTQTMSKCLGVIHWGIHTLGSTEYGWHSIMNIKQWPLYNDRLGVQTLCWSKDVFVLQKNLFCNCQNLRVKVPGNSISYSIRH